MYEQKISWDHIEELNDIEITYLLYREGKSIEAIEKIRNYSREKVEKHIIEAKIEIHSIDHDEEKKKKTTLDRLLELSKEERLEKIESLSLQERKELINEIKRSYKIVKNSDDKMILIWIVGEMKEEKLIDTISKDILHRNGNIRRMVCSALGKIGDCRTKNILHRAIYDKKPQVRQYAVKALKDIGDESTISLLNGLIVQANEKKYVKNTCIDTIKSIKDRIHNIPEKASN